MYLLPLKDAFRSLSVLLLSLYSLLEVQNCIEKDDGDDKNGSILIIFHVCTSVGTLLKQFVPHVGESTRESENSSHQEMSNKLVFSTDTVSPNDGCAITEF